MLAFILQYGIHFPRCVFLNNKLYCICFCHFISAQTFRNRNIKLQNSVFEIFRPFKKWSLLSFLKGIYCYFSRLHRTAFQLSLNTTFLNLGFYLTLPRFSLAVEGTARCNYADVEWQKGKYTAHSSLCSTKQASG